MKKSLLFLILTISFLLPSCGSSGENQPSQSPQQSFGEERIEFTDALGQAFSLPRPKRVVAIIGSFADIWCLAGGEGNKGNGRRGSKTRCRFAGGGRKVVECFTGAGFSISVAGIRSDYL